MPKQPPEHDYRVPVPDDVMETMTRLGRVIGGTLPPGWGFGLLIFTIGEGGTLAWISSADRNDMLKVMAEFIQKQES